MPVTVSWLPMYVYSMALNAISKYRYRNRTDTQRLTHDYHPGPRKKVRDQGTRRSDWQSDNL